MLVYPSIDLRNGRAVRSSQGDYHRRIVDSNDPIEIAMGFLRSGASCLHVTNVDGANAKNDKSRSAIKQLTEIPLWMQVMVPSCNEAEVKALLDLGVKRVVVSAIGSEEFHLIKNLVAKYADAIAVSVDIREEDATFYQALQDTGVGTVIFVDRARKGKMMGANIAAYEKLTKLSGLHMLASGGISFEMEIEKLRDMHLNGVILGKALYAGKLSLVRSIAIANGELEPC